jgi:hypothetical protein
VRLRTQESYNALIVIPAIRLKFNERRENCGDGPNDGMDVLKDIQKRNHVLSRAQDCLGLFLGQLDSVV